MHTHARVRQRRTRLHTLIHTHKRQHTRARARTQADLSPLSLLSRPPSYPLPLQLLLHLSPAGTHPSTGFRSVLSSHPLAVRQTWNLMCKALDPTCGGENWCSCARRSLGDGTHNGCQCSGPRTAHARIGSLQAHPRIPTRALARAQARAHTGTRVRRYKPFPESEPRVRTVARHRTVAGADPSANADGAADAGIDPSANAEAAADGAADGAADADADAGSGERCVLHGVDYVGGDLDGASVHSVGACRSAAPVAAGTTTGYPPAMFSTPSAGHPYR
jgi:hypothetical protein